jgi:hypothetical protein
MPFPAIILKAKPATANAAGVAYGQPIYNRHSSDNLAEVFNLMTELHT